MPTTPDDVCLNKAAVIERALRRMREEYAADPGLASWTHVDAMTLNIERACQAAIDMAMHLVARERLGMPQGSADAFRLLEEAGHLTAETSRAMHGMVGFRNIAIHAYQQLDQAVLRHIAEQGWRSVLVFCHELGLRIEP